MAGRRSSRSADSSADQISVDVTGETSKKLASYWGGLVKEGVLSTDADFSNQWYQALNKGKYATWLTAAWGPVFLSTSAKDTGENGVSRRCRSGTAGEQKSGNWGGSTTRRHQDDQEPDRGRQVRPVPQHRPRVGAEC